MASSKQMADDKKKPAAAKASSRALAAGKGCAACLSAQGVAFRDFVLRGNIVDLAVAVVVGAAFTALVNALVSDWITPLIGAIFQGGNFDELTFTVNGSVFNYGHFINTLIYFLIVCAIVFFLVVQPVAALLRKFYGAPKPTRSCPYCLSPIPEKATRCKFCCSEVEPLVPEVEETDDAEVVTPPKVASKTTKAGTLGEAERSMDLDATRGAEREYAEMEKLEKLFDLTGRVALVTGASRGVGAAVAMGMSRCGAKVVVADILDQGEVVRNIMGLGEGHEVLAVKCDVRDRQSVDSAVAQAAENWGRLDIVVANAGILGHLVHPEKVEPELWREVMSVNLEGVYACAQAACPYLKKNKYGKIIFMSSIAAQKGFGAQVPYCVSKGGLLPLAKSLAVAWGKDNIQVNCVLPGAINTPFLDSVLNTPEKVKSILTRIPAGRLGVSEDLVGPAIFLASHASDYVTGTEIVVDGGGTQVPMLSQQMPEDYGA